MDCVVGVMKALHHSRRGGPLPTENSEIADLLHSMGREFGANHRSRPALRLVRRRRHPARGHGQWDR